MVFVNFILAEVTTFNTWPSNGINKGLFFLGIQSGLVGVFVTLSFGQLLPELLAQEYPLRFMNMIGSLTVGRISLFFDMVGVGHCAWAVYYVTRKLICRHARTDFKSPRKTPGIFISPFIPLRL